MPKKIYFIFIVMISILAASSRAWPQGTNPVLGILDASSNPGFSLDLQKVIQAIDSIPDERVRKVLHLSMEGKPAADVAVQIGIPVSEVEASLQSGIAQVKQILTDQGGALPENFQSFNEMTVPVIEQPSGPATANINVQPANGKGKSTYLDVLDLKNMDVMDVFKLISQKSGVNIVAGQNVKGRVTVYLKGVDVQDALRIIVDAYGWAYTKDGDIVKIITAQEYEAKYGQKFGQETETRIQQLGHISPTDLAVVLNQIKSTVGKVIPDEKSSSVILIDEPKKLDEMGMIITRMDVPITTETFDLSYAQAEEISGKISEVLTPVVGKMKFDKRSNRIVVADTASKLKDIKHIIDAFDKKDEEVLIEAKIIQIVLSDEHKTGVDWEGIVQDYHSLDLTGHFDVIGTTDKRGKVSIGTIGDDDYTALLEALQTVGVTNILSSPRIVAVNDKEAKILIGSTEPYVTNTVTTPSSGPTTTAESVNFIEVGVKLFVTPTIHNDGFITMKIKPEVSSVVRNITTSTNNVIPVVETSEAETVVMAKDGVTIVIGGLMKDEKIQTTKKVPFLGDIPILGYAFKNDSDKVKKTEIAIFLTPRIITGDVQAKTDSPFRE